LYQLIQNKPLLVAYLFGENKEIKPLFEALHYQNTHTAHKRKPLLMAKYTQRRI